MKTKFLDVNKSIIDAIFALNDVELNDEELDEAIDDIIDDNHEEFVPKVAKKKKSNKKKDKVKILKIKKL